MAFPQLRHQAASGLRRHHQASGRPRKRGQGLSPHPGDEGGQLRRHCRRQDLRVGPTQGRLGWSGELLGHEMPASNALCPQTKGQQQLRSPRQRNQAWGREEMGRRSWRPWRLLGPWGRRSARSRKVIRRHVQWCGLHRLHQGLQQQGDGSDGLEGPPTHQASEEREQQEEEGGVGRPWPGPTQPSIDPTDGDQPSHHSRNDRGPSTDRIS